MKPSLLGAIDFCAVNEPRPTIGRPDSANKLSPCGFIHCAITNNSSHRGIIALLVVAAWSAGPHAPAQVFQIHNSAATDSRSDHADRCIAAVDLAILAAESGAMEVSMEAVRRACQQGPPVANVDLGGILSSSPRSQAMHSSSSQSDDSSGAAQAELAKKLCKLHDVWVESEVDPQQAYRTWKDLILPPGRPNDAFCYSSRGTMSTSISYGSINFSVKRPKPVRSGAANLAYWARQADQVDDLSAELDKRAKLPGAADTVILIRVLLAGDESSPPSDAEALCRELATRPALLIEHPYADLLFGHTWQMIERLGADSSAATELIEAVLAATPSHQRWSANEWLQFLASKRLRDSVAAGELEEFRQAAQLVMSQYNAIRGNNTEYVASREASLYAEAAKRAFQKEHYDLGVTCLNNLSLISASPRYGNVGVQELLDPTSPTMKGVMQMEPAARRKLLNNLVWRLPVLGLEQQARLRRADRAPRLFWSDDAEPVANRVARADGVSYSLLEWTVRESLAAGQRGEVEARIQELESRGSDDAKLARLILSLAADEPIDLELFAKTDENGKRQLLPAMGPSTPVSLLDLELLHQALQDPEWSEAAGELWKERLATATKRAQRSYVAWLRRLQLEGAQALGDDRATHESLAHWTVASNFSQHHLRAGHAAPDKWVERESGAWGQSYGPHVSYLLLRYPLQGDFSVEVRASDGPWQEGGLALGGLFLEPLAGNEKLVLRTVGERGGAEIKTTAFGEGGMTSHRLECRDGNVRLVMGEEKFETKLGSYSEAFPFFALNSFGKRETTFDSLKITGETTIPREVKLLSPLLLGWTDYFKSGRMPGVVIEPGKLELAPTKPNGQIDEWRYADDELQSVDQVAERAKREKDPDAKPWVEKRREGLLQYLRPLCDNEQVQLEFYHEPDKFSLAPCVGRIALLLDQPEVGLHWITGDSKLWTAVGSTNRVVDPAAETLAPVALKENAWNELTLRLEGETVMLSINGELVYRRTWEPEAGRQFGLFHDPSRYQIRVRNVRLSGDWPEKLPQDFMELRPASKIEGG